MNSWQTSFSRLVRSRTAIILGVAVVGLVVLVALDMASGAASFLFLFSCVFLHLLMHRGHGAHRHGPSNKQHSEHTSAASIRDGTT